MDLPRFRRRHTHLYGANESGDTLRPLRRRRTSGILPTPHLNLVPLVQYSGPEASDRKRGHCDETEIAVLRIGHLGSTGTWRQSYECS
jgi:hypothetical protein